MDALLERAGISRSMLVSEPASALGAGWDGVRDAKRLTVYTRSVNEVNTISPVPPCLAFPAVPIQRYGHGR